MIGKNGELPWHIPEDMEHFRELTTGNPVLMGRKTFESLPDSVKPLPDRTNIVLTRSGVEADVYEAESLDEGYRIAEEHGDEKVFIIGGAGVYRQTLDQADKMILTEIKEEYEGDTYFPDFEEDDWVEEKREDHEKFSFVTYTREN